MLRVLVAGLVGTVLGVVVMVIVILASGTTTEGASTIGENLQTVTSPGGSSVTPTTTPGGSTTPAGGSTGGSTSGGGSTGSSGGAGDAANGKTLFASSNCGGCHTLQAAGTSGQIGPDLDNVSSDQQASGQPEEQFLTDSIVDPGAYIAKGYSDAMPPKGGADLSDQDVADLVAFIAQSQS